MALRDQPYLPLYVQDFLTDEKLIECSASATGVYIRLLCIMHKSDEYGTILLRQKDKQTENVCQNFACKLAKQMPYEVDIINESLKELIDEGVIQWKNDKLLQKRMLHDNNISLVRSEAGQKGGFATANKPAKDVANTEYEYEYENEVKNNKKLIKKKFDFEAVWILHPKKLGKNEALGYFNIDIKTESDYQRIMKAVVNYAKHVEEKQYEPKYIKTGNNWFKDWESWVDYVEPKTEEQRRKDIGKQIFREP